jgi:integrase/recombinase XerD
LPKRKPLDSGDIEKLIQYCQTHRDKLVILTLLDTGLRVSELIKLQPTDIFWQRGYLAIKGKGGKERIVPMTERVRALLEHHFALFNEVGFTSETARNIVRRIAERAKIAAHVTPHILRHTFAVDALNKGVDIKAVQEVMGHSSITTTEEYLQYTQERTHRQFQEKGWL